MLKDIAGQALMWIGIVGAAVTLFSGLLAPLDMTDWAWWLVQNWQDATPLVWDRLAAWLGAEVPSALVPPLTMSAFLLLAGIGVGFRDRTPGAQIVVGYPILQLTGAMAALLIIGYLLLANAASSSTGSSAPSDAPIAIFLAGAAISFSPIIAGSGNLAKRLWFVLLGTGILVVANEMTKITLQLLASEAPG
jgi:hypothetical protein